MQKKVTLACTECGSRNYSYEKKSTSAERLELKKFCKNCNAHPDHKETK